MKFTDQPRVKKESRMILASLPPAQNLTLHERGLSPYLAQIEKLLIELYGSGKIFVLFRMLDNTFVSFK